MWSCAILHPWWISKSRVHACSPAQLLSMIAHCDTCEIALRSLLLGFTITGLVTSMRLNRCFQFTGPRSPVTLYPPDWSRKLQHTVRASTSARKELMLSGQSQPKARARKERTKEKRARRARGLSHLRVDCTAASGRSKGKQRGEQTFPCKACRQTMIMSCSSCDAASFPLRLPSGPPEPEGCSRRLQQRWASKLTFWKIVQVGASELLYSSKWHGSQRHFASVSSGTAHHAAEDVLLRQLWRKAKFERELVKNARFQDGYCRIFKSPSQVPLCASLVAEPNDDTFVDMLTALPQVDADFYAKEANCIYWTGTSRAIQSELEEQFVKI